LLVETCVSTRTLLSVRSSETNSCKSFTQSSL
jgi:hypothetical protein